MTTQNDGGPAFPVPHAIDGNWVKEPLEKFSGMTLRDYFAGQALAGYRANDSEGFQESSNMIADWSYKDADAMIAARERKGQP